jgi:translocator protein
MKIQEVIRLVLSIAICQFAGILGALFTAPAIPGWYEALEKPALNPPSWIFGPVWIFLYLLMGIALFLIWEKGFKNKKVKTAMGIFSIQLILNALWTPLFFGAQNPVLAFIDITLLWLAIIWTMHAFYKVSKPATYLLIPYIIWVSFAIYLNASFIGQ